MGSIRSASRSWASRWDAMARVATSSPECRCGHRPRHRVADHASDRWGGRRSAPFDGRDAQWHRAANARTQRGSMGRAEARLHVARAEAHGVDRRKNFAQGPATRPAREPVPAGASKNDGERYGRLCGTTIAGDGRSMPTHNIGIHSPLVISPLPGRRRIAHSPGFM